MPYDEKEFNDDDLPRFIPVGVDPEEVIPVGKEDNYTQDSEGNWWRKRRLI